MSDQCGSGFQPRSSRPEASPTSTSTPQRTRGEAQRRIRAFSQYQRTTSLKARSQGAQAAAVPVGAASSRDHRGRRPLPQVPVRRSERAAKRNAEFGLSAKTSGRLRSKPEAKARELRLSLWERLPAAIIEAGGLSHKYQYAAANARRSATPDSGFQRSRPHMLMKSLRE